MLKRWWMVLVAALVAAGITFASTKFRQVEQWPSRPLTMIVPFAAGGPTDVVGRIVAERLGDILGQQVVVENVGGAGGMTGAQRVALASPDGYQVLFGTVGAGPITELSIKSRSTMLSRTSRRSFSSPSSLLFSLYPRIFPPIRLKASRHMSEPTRRNWRSVPEAAARRPILAAYCLIRRSG